MEQYRRTAHTRFDIKFHLVWITKYRKKLLRGEVGVRLRQIVRTICAELEVEILKGYVSVEHVHLSISRPPHVSASYRMQPMKGEEFEATLARVQHSEQRMLGPAPLGDRLLRGEFGEPDRRDDRGVLSDEGR
jgi:putative transposase